MHGTKAENVMGILQEGFMPSRSGRYGPGVYLTNDCLFAAAYSRTCADERRAARRRNYVIMSKVKVAEQPQERPGESPREITFQDYLDRGPTLRYKISDSQVDINELPVKSERDSENSKLLKRTVFSRDQFTIAVAHHELVTPAYLIVFENDLHIDGMVQNILYEKLKENGFITPLTPPLLTLPPLRSKGQKRKLANFTVEMLRAEVENKLNEFLQFELKKVRFILIFLNVLK